MTEEALKLALEAFDSMIGRKPERVEQAITAIKEALAQASQEPVLWMMPDGKTADKWALQFYGGQKGKPLYTTPPQRKPLTDEMRKQMKERCDSMEMRGAFADGWLSAEVAHGIKE